MTGIRSRLGKREGWSSSETNCLSMSQRGEVDLLAVTLLPCAFCATMIAAYGVKTVVYREEYDKDVQAHEIFDFYKVNLLKINDE